MIENRGPDGLPLLYSMPHVSDCGCVTCKVQAELVWAMAHYWDAETSSFELSLAPKDGE